MKKGDIVRVGFGNHCLAVIMEINEDEEMCVVKDSQIEDKLPLRYVREATAEDMADELRSIYGYYN